MGHKRNYRHRITNETRDILCEAFPLCFAKPGKPKRPLKLGIADDIKERMPALAKWRISHALYSYTDGPTYLDHVVEGAERIDLDGNPVGDAVTAEQARQAAWFSTGMSVAREADRELYRLRKAAALAAEALAPMRRHYELNDLHERRDDDVIEIPVGDVEAAVRAARGLSELVAVSAGQRE